MFDDLEILTGKKYRLEIKVDEKLFIFKWREPKIKEMIYIIEELSLNPDKSSIEHQLQLEVLIFEFLNKLDTEYTIEHFKKISPDKITEAIKLITEPIYGKSDGIDRNGRRKQVKAVIKIMRQFGFLMRYSNGAFTHDDILNLTFSQFKAYSDSIVYSMRSETKDGQRENYITDKKDEISKLTKEDVEKIKEEVKSKKARWLKMMERQVEHEKNNQKKDV